MAKKKKGKNLEDLVNEALLNVDSDRKKVLDAYQKLEKVFDNAEQTMMAGTTAVKLLEQLTKANDQVVKLAQIKERQESRTKSKDDGTRSPLDVEQLQKLYESDEIN